MKKIVTLLFIVFYSFCVAQQPGGEYIVKIDAASGSYTNTGPAIAGITWVFFDDRAFIESTGTYIFPSSINAGLFSIDVSNDAIVSNPVLTAPIWYFQYNNVTGKLHGLQQDNLNNQKKLVVINPATGTFTQIGNPLPGSSLYQGAFSAFDKTNNVFIFHDPSNIIYSLNALTGSVIYSPTLALPAGQYLRNLCFDNSAGKLYALIYDNNLSLNFLATINRVTGNVTTIGAGTPLGGSGSSAIDEANQKFIYMYNGGGSVTTLNMSNGNVINSASVTLSPAGANFHSLIYDNSQGNLYAMHWQPTNCGSSPLISVNGQGTICLGQSATLTANGADTYTWLPSPSSNSIVVTPTITKTYTVSGTSTLTGCTNSITVTVNVVVCAGINSYPYGTLNNPISIYPNPTSGVFILTCEETVAENVEIYNAFGSLVYFSKIKDNRMDIDLRAYANGIYFIKTGGVTKKLIKVDE